MPFKKRSQSESAAAACNKEVGDSNFVRRSSRQASSAQYLVDGFEDESFVRRSTRAPSQSLMDTREVKTILDKIRSNHQDTVVLKLKHYLRADITSAVLDEIIDALYSNKVCQALYVQNLSNAMKDKQLKDLIELLKKKKIWFSITQHVPLLILITHPFIH